MFLVFLRKTHSTTKLPWFSHLLQHSIRTRDGLILQCSCTHTAQKSIQFQAYF